jgi:hypothetical protein
MSRNSALKNESLIWPSKSMPNHGVELIDGIPVILKGSDMFAFQPGTPITNNKIKLGSYNTTTHIASWEYTEEMKKWVEEFQIGLSPRSRK